MSINPFKLTYQNLVGELFLKIFISHLYIQNEPLKLTGQAHKDKRYSIKKFMNGQCIKKATTMPIKDPRLKIFDSLGIQLTHLSFSVQHEQAK